MVAFNICAGIVAAYVIFAAVEANDVKSKMADVALVAVSFMFIALMNGSNIIIK